jgi:hypothetical protein
MGCGTLPINPRARRIRCGWRKWIGHRSSTIWARGTRRRSCGKGRPSVTARDFEPGERIEVDYAGDTFGWIERSTGEIHPVYVFVADLGFSQLLFAWAAEDTCSRNWLSDHRRMFEFYGGVSHGTVPDCLKQRVLKCPLYDTDPDLNPGYTESVAHYATAVFVCRLVNPMLRFVCGGTAADCPPDPNQEAARSLLVKPSRMCCSTGTWDN